MKTSSRGKHLILILLPILFTGCGVVSLSTFRFTGTTDATSTGIYPPTLTLTAHSNSSCSFTGTSGKTPYAYSIVSGPGAVDPSSGLFTAPATVGTTIVQVADAAGATFTAQVNTVSKTANGNIAAITTDASGNTYIGGSFTSVFPASALRGVLLDSTSGAQNLAFDVQSGFNAQVNAAAFLSDGSVLVGGLFSTYRGQSVGHFVKLTPAGALDPTFNMGTAFDGGINAIVVSGTSIFVGGSFSNYNSATANGIAKLDATSGALDTTFNPSGTGFDDYVSSIVVSGTDLYVGGNFANYRSAPAARIAKMDTTTGTLDTTFSGAGFDNTVNAIAISGTDLYVGGNFANYRSSSAANIAKLNMTSGALDTTFDNGGTGFQGGYVFGLAATSTAVYVTGYFSTYRGSTAYNIAKLNATTGVLDTTFDNAGTGFSDIGYGITISGSYLYVAGGFTSYRGSAAPYVAKLDLVNGTLDPTFTSGAIGMDGAATAIAVSGSQMFLGGVFSSYGGTAANRIAKFLPDGSLDTAFESTGVGFADTVNTLGISGTSLFVGGWFHKYRGATANAIAKLDTGTGALDSTFDASGTGFASSGVVYGLAVSGTSIYAVGTFTTYRGSAAKYIAKMDTTNGTLNTTFDNGGTGFNTTATSIIVSGTDVFVGGSFTTYRGSAAKKIAKMDATNGTLNTTFDNAGTGFTGTVNALALSGSELYVGGTLTQYRGSTINNVAKMDTTNGTLDATFNPTGSGTNSAINSVTVSGTDLYLGGNFTTYNGSAAKYFAKVDAVSGTIDPTFALLSGFSSFVSSTFLSGTNILVGGTFKTYDGAISNCFATVDTVSGALQ